MEVIFPEIASPGPTPFPTFPKKLTAKLSLLGTGLWGVRISWNDNLHPWRDKLEKTYSPASRDTRHHGAPSTLFQRQRYSKPPSPLPEVLDSQSVPRNPTPALLGPETSVPASSGQSPSPRVWGLPWATVALPVKGRLGDVVGTPSSRVSNLCAGLHTGGAETGPGPSAKTSLSNPRPIRP